jgi:hypothetical protein
VRFEENKKIGNLRKFDVVECEESPQMFSLLGRELERGVFFHFEDEVYEILRYRSE